MLRALPVALLLWLAAPAGLAAQDGEVLLQRLRDTFESVRTMQATFEQRTSSSLFDGDAEVLRGTLYLEGESYRLESGLRTLVNDGSTLWIYDAAASQVIISDYEEDAYTFSITGFLYRFDERYRFRAVDRVPGGWVLHLDPLDPDEYFRSVSVTMRESDNLVTRVEVSDANEVELEFTLADLVRNPDLPADTFRFEAPNGVEIVDLRD